MNEYTVLYLNGITAYISAANNKDILIEADLHAQRNEFTCLDIKKIVDTDGNIIKNLKQNYAHNWQ